MLTLCYSCINEYRIYPYKDTAGSEAVFEALKVCVPSYKRIYVMANFSFGSASGFTDIQAAWTSGPATRTALNKLSLNQPNLVRI